VCLCFGINRRGQIVNNSEDEYFAECFNGVFVLWETVRIDFIFQPTCPLSKTA